MLVKLKSQFWPPACRKKKKTNLNRRNVADKTTGTRAILFLESSRAHFEGDSFKVEELAQKKEGKLSHQGEAVEKQF